MHHIAPRPLSTFFEGINQKEKITNLLLLLDLGGLLSASLLLALALLQKSLRNQDLVLGRDGSAEVSD